MSLFNNVKISNKIVGLLLMLGAITLFIAWQGSQRLVQTSTSYGRLVDVKLPNNTNFVRVNRSLTAMVHANVHNHFNLERHLVDRQTYKERRSAALAEWQVLAS